MPGRAVSSLATVVANSGDPMLRMEELSKVLPGGRKLFREVSGTFVYGAKVGIVGANGTGKSTLLRLLAGQDTEVDGNIWRRDGIRVGLLEQEPQLDESRTVGENIADGLADINGLIAEYERVAMAMSDPDADYAKLGDDMERLQAAIDAADGWNLDYAVATAKAALRVATDDTSVASLSGGERRRVALCRLVLERPDILLLDEPTNHLDTASVAWLEQWLQSFPGTVIAITHDRYFLDNVANWIVELNVGKLHPHEGNYSSWLEARATRMENEDKAGKRKAAALAAELAWIRGGRSGQQAKSKARVAKFEAMREDADEESAAKKFQRGTIRIPPGPRLGQKVLAVQGLSKTLPAAGDKPARVLLDNVSFEVPRGALVGIVGGNGMGKTTLLHMLHGGLASDAGSVMWGETVERAMAAQHRDELPGHATVMDAVSDGTGVVAMGDRSLDVRAYLAGFNLNEEHAAKRISSLSGGERNRVHLARTLVNPCNFLMLDEPTNDLDVDTLRALENALSGFHGAGLIVSHDRYFLDRVTTHTLAFEGDGVVRWFDGPYSEYAAWAKANGITAAQVNA